MKKELINKATTSDMPMDAVFTPPEQQPKTTQKKTQTKSKIKAIGETTKNKVNNKKFKESADFSVGSDLRNKLADDAVDLGDLDKLNEENVKNFRFKSKRNKVVIIILSVLLATVIAGIGIFMWLSKLETNCNIIVHGADATVYVDNTEMTKFRAPANLQGNSSFMFTLKIRIEEGGKYKIRFIPKCYQKNVLMKNTVVRDHNSKLFFDSRDGYFESIDTIKGYQTVELCGGIVLDKQYEYSLSVENFRLDFHIYCEKV